MILVVLVVVAIGVGFDVSEGSGSGPRPGLVYVRGGAGTVPQVWLAGPDGRNARRLGPGTQPLLAPEGSLVAFSPAKRAGPALVLYSADDSSIHGFFSARRDTAVAQAWSPDSRYLAVTLWSTDPLSDAGSGLAVIDTQTFTYRLLARGAIYGAGFAADGSDRLAYAQAASAAVSARVDIHLSAPDGTGASTITHDGRSLYPVWGQSAIAFTHERLRRGADPVYQLWTMRPDGSDRVALTHLRVPPLIDGLVPISFSGAGAWVLAEYQGQDTSHAWAVSVASRQAHPLEVHGSGVAGSALSRGGSDALVDVGGYLNPPDQGEVYAVPLGGGRPTLLVRHGSDPSWNR